LRVPGAKLFACGTFVVSVTRPKKLRARLEQACSALNNPHTLDNYLYIEVTYH
jgi:hypothetical protein